jgi:hypothetical protein
MQIKSVLKTGMVALVVLMIVPAQAKSGIVSQNKNIIVETPQDLPKAAQQTGQDMLFYGAANGNTYLYVEQAEGKQMAVFNVTDPASIKEDAVVAIQAPGPYDFIRTLTADTEMVRFRADSRVAVLDVHKLKAPVLHAINNQQKTDRMELLGPNGFFMVNCPHTVRPAGAPHDYQVVDTTDPKGPTVLYVVRQVKQSITDKGTGTTYLLAADGLYLVRRPNAEQKHRLQEQQKIGN